MSQNIFLWLTIQMLQTVTATAEGHHRLILLQSPKEKKPNKNI